MALICEYRSFGLQSSTYMGMIDETNSLMPFVYRQNPWAKATMIELTT